MEEEARSASIDQALVLGADLGFSAATLAPAPVQDPRGRAAFYFGGKRDMPADQLRPVLNHAECGDTVMVHYARSQS